jgi:hypothetical protein
LNIRTKDEQAFWFAGLLGFDFDFLVGIVMGLRVVGMPELGVTDRSSGIWVCRGVCD